ncbi:transporter [Acidisoma sp. S159]|uniref:transporter n=1 Tax=Acidisoma sp. S159 TaxID=1747225 RepID=UPI001C20160C|nr:transporter [Acidisoma sp. S159]
MKSIPIWLIAFVPVVATLGGAWLALVRTPGRATVSAVQHLAAGVVVAAAAAEVLPGLKHAGAEWAVALGGGTGIFLMLGVRWLDTRLKGTTGLLATVGLDVLVDGLVLGAAATAGERAGLLLTVALTLEVLFLGLSLAPELAEKVGARGKVLTVIGGLLLLLPLGAAGGGLIAGLPRFWQDCFLAFALVALLYLVVEELLAEAHKEPDTPLATALFFVGFLGLLILDGLA